MGCSQQGILAEPALIYKDWILAQPHNGGWLSDTALYFTAAVFVCVCVCGGGGGIFL